MKNFDDAFFKVGSGINNADLPGWDRCLEKSDLFLLLKGGHSQSRQPGEQGVSKFLVDQPLQCFQVSAFKNQVFPPDIFTSCFFADFNCLIPEAMPFIQ